MELLLPRPIFGYGLASLPDLLEQAVGPIRLPAQVCASLSGPLLDRCGDEAGLLHLVSDNLTGDEVEIPSFAFLMDDFPLAQLLLRTPLLLRAQQPMAQCVQLGSSTLLRWFHALDRCPLPLRMECLEPPARAPQHCEALLGLALQDAFAHLLMLGQAILQEPFRKTAKMVLQQQNLQLWQVAAGARWGVPRVRFAGVAATNVPDDAPGEKRYHMISRILQSYSLHGGSAVYAELGVALGDTTRFLAQTVLPFLKEIHLVEPDGRTLHLAGSRVAAAAPHWRSCVEAEAGARHDAVALRRASQGLFRCAELPIHLGNIYLHPRNATVGAARFRTSSLDVVFVDSMGRFQRLLQDLELLWKALKPGGVLLGHDFYHVHTAAQHINNVVGVALSFAVRKQRQLFLSGDQTFWMVK